MIQDLDDTLKELLIQKLPINNGAIDIRFEIPNQEWETRLTLTKPTIDLFLYDIRENHELRSNETYLTRNGTTGTQTKAPIRIDLAYLITVWTKEAADEHQLLGDILKTLLRYLVLPAEVLRGEMVNQSLPLRAWIAQPDRTPNAWDFWGAVDGRLKAGIYYIVTVAIEPTPATEVGLVTENVIKIGTRVPSN
jgi:hypothetical protein